MADGHAPAPAAKEPAKASRAARLGGLVNDKFVASVLTGLAGLAVAVLTTTLTPLGEDLRERVAPTAAVVEGLVSKQGLPVARAEVVLDGRRSTRTASLGEYFFADVAAGLHTLQIVEGGALVYERAFAVDRRAVRVVVGQTDLALAVPVPERPSTVELPTPTGPGEDGGGGDQPGGGGAGSPAASPGVLVPLATGTATATPHVPGRATGVPTTGALAPTPSRTPPAATPPSASPTPAARPTASPTPLPTASPTPFPPPTPVPTPPPTLEVGLAAAPGGGPLATARVVAPAAVLADVARVTYRLPAGFNPSVIARYSPADGFALAFVPAAGETTVLATVYFADGRTLDLAATVRA